MNDFLTYTFRRHSSFKKGFEILGPSGAICFNVREKWFSFGRTFLVFDTDEKQVAKIRQCFVLMLPKYRIFIGEETPFSVRRKFSLQPRYLLSDASTSIEGTFQGQQYQALDTNGNSVFILQEIYESWTDKFQLSIPDTSDLLRNVCIAISMNAADEDILRAGKD